MELNTRPWRSRITCHNFAVGHEETELTMGTHISDGPNSKRPIEFGTRTLFNLGGMQLAGPLGAGPRVRVRPLDAVAHELGFTPDDVVFIKIDVEGFEGGVLEGARSLLGEGADHPAVMFERNGRVLPVEIALPLAIRDPLSLIVDRFRFTTLVRLPGDNWLCTRDWDVRVEDAAREESRRSWVQHGCE